MDPIVDLRKLCKVEKDSIGSPKTYRLTFDFRRAFVTARIVLDDPSGADVIITNLVVHPEKERGIGYGHTALRTILSWAKRNQLENICAVQVQKLEPVEKFWERHGFVGTRNHSNDFRYEETLA